MTGFGKADAQFGGKKIHVEIRSLNSKTLDVSARMPPLYREREPELLAAVAENVVRGKVDLSVTAEPPAAVPPPISEEAARSRVAQIRGASRRCGIAEPAEWWPLLLRFPDVMSPPAGQEPPCGGEWDAVKGALSEALAALTQFRRQEGLALQSQLAGNVGGIESLLRETGKYEKARAERIKARLAESLSEIKGLDLDRNRLEQEMIYYIEKLDVSEEKQRLANHLKYFRETMDGPAGQGRKLGFIAQEMGREINTLGSKSNHAGMQNLVVMMKDHLEQIKEQVLNAL